MKTRYDFYNLKHFIPITVLALTVTNIQAATLYTNAIDQKRENIVLSVKEGKVDVGLSKLKQLLENNQDNQKLIADYLLLSIQNKRYLDEDLRWLEYIQAADFPTYAQLSLIKAYRDKKQFSNALHLLEKFKKINNSIDFDILKAVLLAENQ